MRVTGRVDKLMRVYEVTEGARLCVKEVMFCLFAYFIVQIHDIVSLKHQKLQPFKSLRCHKSNVGSSCYTAVM